MPQHRFRAQLKVSTVQQQTEEKVVDKKNKMNFLTNIKFDNPFDKYCLCEMQKSCVINN